MTGGLIWGVMVLQCEFELDKNMNISYSQGSMWLYQSKLGYLLYFL